VTEDGYELAVEKPPRGFFCPRKNITVSFTATPYGLLYFFLKKKPTPGFIIIPLGFECAVGKAPHGFVYNMLIYIYIYIRTPKKNIAVILTAAPYGQLFF
jgi:hypothetical protein